MMPVDANQLVVRRSASMMNQPATQPIWHALNLRQVLALQMESLSFQQLACVLERCHSDEITTTEQHAVDSRARSRQDDKPD